MLAKLSIHRPAFITCIVLFMLSIGYFAATQLGVEFNPAVNIPYVSVVTIYKGAGPTEIESLVSKPIEDALATLPGLKHVRSTSQEGISQVSAEFTLETDPQYAEQQVRDHVGAIRPSLPKDIDEPLIQKIDENASAILRLSLSSKEPVSAADLFDMADQKIKPLLEQVPHVGRVDIVGARKRQIQVLFDAKKMKDRELSMTQLNSQLSSTGDNIPAGTVQDLKKESNLRTLGQYNVLDTVSNTIISSFGGERSLRIKDLAEVRDSLEDETSRAYMNGSKTIFLEVYKQSGANTVAIAKDVLKRVDRLKAEVESLPGHPTLSIVEDSSIWIKNNVDDVKESIFFGIILAVLVVFTFLQSSRSTLITALALPNSLLGAFILMWLCGYTINQMTLLALSLSVGLLIDDAIVVRENIFRHIEMGKKPIQAALDGTAEVQMAVVATTFTVLAVFGPIAFLKGIVGQFFKQFGFVICFAMLISLFDALTIAPMLSAYFAGSIHRKKGFFERLFAPYLNASERTQKWLENKYVKVLTVVLRYPGRSLLASALIFILCVCTLKWVPITFNPSAENGEFTISYHLPSDAALEAIDEVGQKMDLIVRENKEVLFTTLSVGVVNGDTGTGELYVKLVPQKQRKLNTTRTKDKIREQLKDFSYANPTIGDWGGHDFQLLLKGSDEELLKSYSNKVLSELKKMATLKDVDFDYRSGKPEIQLKIKDRSANELGVSPSLLGNEMHALIEGVNVAKYRVHGREYDIHTRLKEEQRNAEKNFDLYYVPNVNKSLIRLSDVVERNYETGPSKIRREDRSRVTKIEGNLAAKVGLGDVTKSVSELLKTQALTPPAGVTYSFSGQAEELEELSQSVLIALFFGLIFIYFALTSLYDSFVTPFAIMLALPLALCGSFAALAITRESLNVLSMIGVIMLIGVAAKNSILLVDHANQLVSQGLSRTEAMIKSGYSRLRPILMTSAALIAGAVPIAIGLTESSNGRSSMGIAIIGGMISSTLLTLIVVPAAYSYIDRFRAWSLSLMKAKFEVE